MRACLARKGPGLCAGALILQSPGEPDGTPDMNQYLKQGLYPVNAPLPTPPWRYKLSPDEHELLLEESKTSSLRSLAGRFGVSHETIRHHLTQVSGCTLSHPALIKGRLHALPFSTPFEAISFIPRATD